MWLMKTVSFSAYCFNCLRQLPRDLFFLVLPLNICRTVFYAIARFIWPTECFRGIRMLDFNRQTRSIFNQKINEALTMIEQNDPRRFQRVQREIRLIVYDRWLIEPLPQGAYFRQAKVCLINLKRFDFNRSPRFKTALLAALILHEATHGLLHRKRLSNEKLLRKKTPHVQRFEVFCNREETRLLLKLGYDLRPFDPYTESNMNDLQYLQRLGEYSDRQS